MLIVAMLVCLCGYFTYTDLTSRMIPNRVIYPAILIALLWRLLEPSFLLGMIPAVLLLGLFFINPCWLGAGDIKLLALVGLVLGLDQMWPMLFLTCFCASLYFIIVKLMRKPGLQKGPLAPFILAGIVLTLVLQNSHI